MSLTNLFDLRGHVAVVTGGNGGIGRSSGPGSRGCGYGHNEEKNRRVLEEFFIDDRRWQSIREDFFRRSGLPSDSKQVPEYLARRLGEAYERFLKAAASNSYAVVDEDGWRLSAEPTEKLDQEEQDRLAHLKS